MASTALALLFIASLFQVHRWAQYWKAISRIERSVLIGFALFALSGFVSYPNVEDTHEFVRHMGRYIRFLLILPVYLILSRPEYRLYRYLLAGAVLSGPLYLVLAFISVSQHPEFPASWQYHHIVFGAAAMLNAIFMITVLATAKTSHAMKAILVVSIFCAVYASIMSTARGAWIALPACFALLLYITVRSGDIKLKTLLLSLLMLVVLVAVSPLTDLIERRYDQAVSEVERFVSGEEFDTSVGGRLAMWHVALNVWKTHPIIGTGPGDFDEDLRASQESGLYTNIDVHANIHNIYLQGLATTGIVGIIALCAGLLLIPFISFLRSISARADVASLAGVMTIVAFAVFGLTESWILRAPLLSLYLVYVITLMQTVSANQTNEEKISRV